MNSNLYKGKTLKNLIKIFEETGRLFDFRMSDM
jgi:hypothetical protein